jgi:hypothetical protein
LRLEDNSLGFSIRCRKRFDSITYGSGIRSLRLPGNHLSETFQTLWKVASIGFHYGVRGVRI